MKAIPEKPGYFDLDMATTMMFTEKSAITQQIKLRCMAEQKLSYSSALNHLLNEFQAICHNLEGKLFDSPNHGKKIKDYKEPQVTKFLKFMRVSDFLITKIGQLFERRNRNADSHPGDDDLPTMDIDHKTYEEQKQVVSACLQEIAIGFRRAS